MKNKKICNKLYIASVKPLYDRDLFDMGYARLSPWRQDKVNKQKFAKGKTLSMGAGLLLNYALSQSGINPNEIEIIFGEYEKPYINNYNVFFNLSHSEEYVICVISNNEIGCDIEKMDTNGDKIAKRFFHEKEFALIAESESEVEKFELFYRLWTLKESFIKTTGQGLHLPLSSFQVIMEDEIKIEHSYNNSNFYFQEFNIVPEYKCAVCIENIKGKIDYEKINIENYL